MSAIRLVSLLRGGGWLEDGVLQAAPKNQLFLALFVVMLSGIMVNARSRTLTMMMACSQHDHCHHLGRRHHEDVYARMYVHTCRHSPRLGDES